MRKFGNVNGHRATAETFNTQPHIDVTLLTQHNTITQNNYNTQQSLPTQHNLTIPHNL